MTNNEAREKLTEARKQIVYAYHVDGYALAEAIEALIDLKIAMEMEKMADRVQDALGPRP